MLEFIAEQLRIEREQQRHTTQINPSKRYKRKEVEDAMGLISGVIIRGLRIYGWEMEEEPGWFRVDVIFLNQRNQKERESWYFYKATER